jgi:hypothetical protein
MFKKEFSESVTKSLSIKNQKPKNISHGTHSVSICHHLTKIKKWHAKMEEVNLLKSMFKK